MPNFLEQISDVKERCGIRNDSSYDTAIKRALNNGQRAFTTRFLWDFLKKTEDVTTVASTEEYTLAAPCVVYNARNTTSNTPLSYITSDELDRYDANHSASGSPRFYIISGQTKASTNVAATPNISLYPIPSGVYTIRVRSYKRLADLTGNSDISEIPEDFQEFMVHYACNVIMSGRNDARASSHYDQSENILISAAEQLGAVPSMHIHTLRSQDEVNVSGDLARLPSNFGEQFD